MTDPHVERCDQAMAALQRALSGNVCGDDRVSVHGAIGTVASHLAQYVRARGGERLAAIDRMLEEERTKP